MEKILLNLAMIELNKFCRAHPEKVNCGTMGTKVVKHGRGFTYNLLTADTDRLIASVQFNKSSVPTFTFTP